MWRETYIIFMNMKWCLWVLDTLILSWTNSHYWLRNHTFWALVELGWRLKVFPSANNLCFEFHHTKVHSLVLIFWNLQAHVIYYEWSRYVIFPLRTCIFPSLTPLLPIHVRMPRLGLFTMLLNACFNLLSHVILWYKFFEWCDIWSLATKVSKIGKTV